MLLAFAADQRRPAAALDLGRALDRVFGTPGYTPATGDQPEAPGTFMRLAARIRKLSFPASFRPFTGFEEEATALCVA